MRKGWNGESQRHSISRRGIKTTINIGNVQHMHLAKGKKKHEFADDLTFFNWNESQIKEFEQEFGKIESVEKGYNRDIIVITENGEYRLFKNSDDAYETAKEQLIDDFESDPGLFPVDWVVEENLTISDTDRRIIAGEESDNYVENLTDDDVISEYSHGYDSRHDEIEKLEEKILEWEEILDEARETGNGSENQIQDRIDIIELEKSKLEEELENFIDEAKEEMREKMYEEIYDQLSDPIQYFIKDNGYYSDVQDLIKSNIVSVDYEGMATTVLDTDGVGHILASYDGEEYEIGDVMIYRVN